MLTMTWPGPATGTGLSSYPAMTSFRWRPPPSMVQLTNEMSSIFWRTNELFFLGSETGDIWMCVKKRVKRIMFPTTPPLYIRYWWPGIIAPITPFGFHISKRQHPLFSRMEMCFKLAATVNQEPGSQPTGAHQAGLSHGIPSGFSL